MALFPYEHPMMRSGNWFDYPTPARIFDQGFGAGVFGDDPLMRDMQRQAECMMRQPYWMRANNQPKGDTGVSEVQCDKDQFQVKLDVRHFKPEELTVKTVDNTLTVEGKHCEKMDEHGFVQRHFVRKYVLPKGVDPGEVSSNLSPHGVLTCKFAAPIAGAHAGHRGRVQRAHHPHPARPRPPRRAE